MGECYFFPMLVSADSLQYQWIHTRNVCEYAKRATRHQGLTWLAVSVIDIPLGYLYGVKFKGEITPLVEEIREVRQLSTTSIPQSLFEGLADHT